jgi:hypothetical protein
MYHLMTKTKFNLYFLILQYMIDSCLAVKQKVVKLPYGIHMTLIFKVAQVSLEGEESKHTFMRFTTETLGQLHITTTNMPTPQKTGSVKRLSDQKVQEVREKQEADKSAKKEIGSSSHKAEKGKPTPAPEVFAHVAEHARELVEASTQQFEAMMARRSVDKVRETTDGRQKVETTLSQGVEAPSEDIRVEENTEQHA